MTSEGASNLFGVLAAAYWGFHWEAVMDVGGVLLGVAVVTGVVFFLGNYRGRYGRSQIGLRGALIVAIIGIGIALAWSAIT